MGYATLPAPLVDVHPGTAGLLAVAKELGLDMAGVSFHVGSGASNPDALPEGIAAAAAVFARAAQHGFAMRMLDIGGGFPGGEHATDQLSGLTVQHQLTRSLIGLS